MGTVADDCLRQEQVSRMSRKRSRKIDGPFIAIPKAIMATKAWSYMSAPARLLWIELRGWLRNDGLNNGKLYLSCRKAADAIGISRTTVARAYAELKHYGYLRQTSPGFLGVDGHGLAAHWRFTDLVSGGQPATREYDNWTGELFVAPQPRGALRKNRTPSRPRDIREPETHASYVPPTGHRRAPGCPAYGTHLDCHSPAPAGGSYSGVAQQ
jgi:hypothetical protein